MTPGTAMSVTETADRLGVSNSTLYRWLDQDEFPLIPIRMGKRIVFPAVQVEFLVTFGHKPSHDELVEFIRDMGREVAS